MTASTDNGQVGQTDPSGTGLSMTLLPGRAAVGPDVAADLAEAQQTIADLRRGAEELRAHNEQVHRALADRGTDLTGLRQEFDEFKQRVRGTAIHYAAKHDWCEVVDDALAEMGLLGRATGWTVTLTVTGTITRTVSATDERHAVAAAMEEVGLAEQRSYTLYDEQLYIDGISATAEPD